jgi:hypothetical protein
VSAVRDVVQLRAADRDVSGGDWSWPCQVFLGGSVTYKL